MTEEAKPNIHQRLAAVMQEVTYVRKEKKQGMNYSIVSHDVVTAKVRPSLVNHGVIYYPASLTHTQSGNRTECAMVVRFVNVDEPTDFLDVHTMGFGIDPQDKGPGKAMSYAVKYALLKCLGLETGDDPDQDQDVEYDGRAAPAEHAAADQADAPKSDTKRVARDTYTRLEKAIRSKASWDELNDWSGDERVKGAIASLPADWREKIMGDLHERRQELDTDQQEAA